MTQVKIDSKFTIKVGDQKMSLTLEELRSLKSEIANILTPYNYNPIWTINYATTPLTTWASSSSGTCLISDK